MSTFNNNGVTLKGAVIIASLVAGGTLAFTRMVVGDGELPTGQTPLSTEKLVNPLFDVTISSVESDSVAHATVKGIFSNANLDTGFYYRELGLYAINPVTGAEELFCYGNAGDDAELISPIGESSLVEKEIHLVTLIGSATTVTANFDPKAPALKSEMDTILPLKADLDATPENGGRVLAVQMRFDAQQTLYVDATAAAGGDGTEAKPFNTIAEAIAAYYPGARQVTINIKSGEYPENLVVENMNCALVLLQRNPGDTGSVVINSIIARYVSVALRELTLTGIGLGVAFSAANCHACSLSTVTITGDTITNGVHLFNTTAFAENIAISQCNYAISVRDNSVLSIRGTSGTDNAVGIVTGESMVSIQGHALRAATPYKRLAGGSIFSEGGDSSFPSNYAQLYYLGPVGTIESLQAALLTEFGKLNERESRTCSFANNIMSGLGPFQGGQNMYVEIIKNSSTGSGYGIVFIRSHFEPAAGYWIIQDGAFITDVPKAFAVVEPATVATFGVLRVAAPVEDELDSTCTDAALTPANVHAMANYRIANTAYEVGDIVGVPYHANFFMECTVAGTTSAMMLDTTSVAIGDIIEDGSVAWVVIPSGATYRTYGGVTDREENKPTYGLS